MGGGSDRVTDVVQAVEKGDEIVILPGGVSCGGDLEGDAVTDAGLLYGALRVQSMEAGW